MDATRTRRGPLPAIHHGGAPHDLTCPHAAPAWLAFRFGRCHRLGSRGAAAAELFRTSGLGPIAVSFWRFAIATALLIAPQARMPALFRPVGRRAAVLTGIALAACQTACFGAVQNAGLALGTLVTLGASPILVGVGAHLISGERLTKRGAAATGIALIGLLTLVARPASGPRPVVGITLAVLSAVGYSAVTLWARQAGTSSSSPVTSQRKRVGNEVAGVVVPPHEHDMLRRSGAWGRGGPHGAQHHAFRRHTEGDGRDRRHLRDALEPRQRPRPARSAARTPRSPGSASPSARNDEPRFRPGRAA